MFWGRIAANMVPDINGDMNMIQPDHELATASKDAASDIDPLETEEWLESLRAVVRAAGRERGRFLMGELEVQGPAARARRSSGPLFCVP